MFVLSANKTYLNLLETFTKSFIWELTRIGPKIDPCGTTQVICSLWDTVVPKETNCER